jgi:hypothetical protein
LPVTFTANVPRAVEPVVRTLMVEVPPALTGFAENVTDAPPGIPVAESETLPVNPPDGATEIRYDAVWVR